MTTIKGLVTTNQGQSYPVEALITLPTSPKQTCYGLADRQGYPRFSSIKTFVLAVPWSALEPEPGIYNFSAIDSVLGSTPLNMTVCLRVEAGPKSPAHILSDSVVLPATGAYSEITVPKIWKPSYQSSVRNLSFMLAQKYDKDPRVREFTAWWQGFEFSEEWTIRRGSNSQVREILRDAGYSSSLDKAQVLKMFQYLIPCFPNTAVQTFVSVYYQNLTFLSGGITRVNSDASFVDQVIRESRALSSNLVIGVNNAKASSWDSDPLYAFIEAYGGNRRDQTLAPSRLGSTPQEQIDALIATIQAAKGNVDTLELPWIYRNYPEVDWDALDF